MTQLKDNKKLAVFALSIFLFEFVVVADFDGAYADDLDLIVVGAGAAAEMPPPNIMFYFDSSGSMHNLICEDLAGAECDKDTLQARDAPNSAQVCKSPELAALTGAPPGGGSTTTYQAPYASDGTTYNSGDRYPMFDARESGTDDDYYRTGSTHVHAWTKPWQEETTGTGSTVQGQIDSAIAEFCETMIAADYCDQRARCIYSLRTQGYFWEPTGNGCATGNPLGLTCSTSAAANAGFGQNGFLCDNGTVTFDCSDGVCDSHGGGAGSVCHQCSSDADCDGTDMCQLTSACTSNPFNACVKSSKIGTCSEAEQPYGEWDPPSKSDGAPLGVFCVDSSDCYNGEPCVEHTGNGGGPKVCSECDSDSDCTGTCETADPNCTYNYCSESGCEELPPLADGPWGGPDVATCECSSSPCTDDNCVQPTTATCGIIPPVPSVAICSTCKMSSGVTYGTNFICGCNTTIAKDTTFGDNVYVGNNVTITKDLVIGDNVYIGDNVDLRKGQNIGDGVYIGNDVDIRKEGDILDGVCIGAGVNIRKEVDIGAGAIIGEGVEMKKDVTIGAGAVIADGAVLGKDAVIAPGEHVAGGAGNNDDLPAFLGDFLNFYPPKSVSLVKVVRDLTADLPGDVRIGASDLGDSSGNVSWEITPACSDMTGTTLDDCFDENPDTGCFDASSGSHYLYNDLVFEGGTPVATKLDNLGLYYSRSTGDVPICDYSSRTACDANNFVIAVSDGFPSGDATSGSSISFTNTSSEGPITDGYYQTNDSLFDDVAKALTVIDHRSDLDDDQTVGTYVISYGFVNSTDPTTCVGLLQSAASAGTGACFTALNVQELKNSFAAAIADILQRALGFSAASMPTVHKQSTDSVYQAVFRPTDDFQLWEGHLFSFKMCDEEIGRQTGETCSCFDGSDDSEVCIQGATDGDRVTFDSNGYLLTADPHWDA